MTQDQIVQALIERRRQLHLSQYALARIIGVLPSTINHFELRQSDGSYVTTIIRYATAVGLELTLKEANSGNEVQLRDSNSAREGTEEPSGL